MIFCQVDIMIWQVDILAKKSWFQTIFPIRLQIANYNYTQMILDLDVYCFP